MAKGDELKKEKVETVNVPAKVLADIQQKMADQDKTIEDMRLKAEGLEAMIDKGATPSGEEKLREKKTFEPKFRTIRLRKYPILGDVNNLGFVTGWTSRGAYQEVDKSGISPQIVDMIEIIFLGNEKTPEGRPKAEKVKLLDLMNKSVQVHCKILDTKKEIKQVPTNEIITINVYDPNHGLVSTGETIDGFTSYSEIQYQVQIPGVAEPVWVDALYCN